MVTRLAFTLLVAGVAFQRLWEVRRSEAHQSRLLSRGGRVHARGQLVAMKILHGSWLLGSAIEVWAFSRPLIPLLAASSIMALVAGQLLRRAAMRALGERWTTGIVTLPGAPAIRAGVYRYLRHPNYVGVALEIAALPLVHTAYVSAVSFSLANAVLLAFRIRAEERALTADNAYNMAFSGTSRFVPPVGLTRRD